jgi:hypothetical protein
MDGPDAVDADVEIVEAELPQIGQGGTQPGTVGDNAEAGRVCLKASRLDQGTEELDAGSIDKYLLADQRDETDTRRGDHVSKDLLPLLRPQDFPVEPRRLEIAVPACEVTPHIHDDPHVTRRRTPNQRLGQVPEPDVSIDKPPDQDGKPVPTPTEPKLKTATGTGDDIRHLPLPSLGPQGSHPVGC